MSAPGLPPTHAGGKFRKGVSGNPGGKKRVVGPAQSPDAQTEKARRNHDGLWKPGQSGNPAGKPKGTLHHATRAVLAMMEGEAEAITRKAIDLALAGDSVALRLVMERLVSPVRERPVNLTMPKVNAAPT